MSQKPSGKTKTIGIRLTEEALEALDAYRGSTERSPAAAELVIEALNAHGGKVRVPPPGEKAAKKAAVELKNRIGRAIWEEAERICKENGD